MTEERARRVARWMMAGLRESLEARKAGEPYDLDYTDERVPLILREVFRESRYPGDRLPVICGKRFAP